MIEWLDKIDRGIFMFFNSMYSPLSDKFWLLITETTTWIPLYALLLAMIMWIFKKDSIYIIASILLVVLFSDQFTSGFMKPFFERLRPCHNPDIQLDVHVASKCGGLYGFASGHAANSFGIAMFTWLLFKSYWKWTWILFIWAFTVAYSRIAIGVHYPGDIVIGGLVGTFFGWIVYYLLNEVYFRIKLEPLIKN